MAKQSCATCKHYGMPEGFKERKGFVTAHPCNFPIPAMPILPEWLKAFGFDTMAGRYRWKNQGIECKCWEKKA